MRKKVLFLDRDGTLIVEPSDNYQVDSIEKLAFLPGVFKALSTLATTNEFLFVIVTNQDGLGSATFPEEQFWPAHQKMLDIFRGEGIVFHEVIIDRTRKEEMKPTRKPGTALLQGYLDGDFDLKNSFVIGDRPTDIQLAKNLGARGILLGASQDSIDNDVDLPALGETLCLKTTQWDEITRFVLSALRKSSVSRVTRETAIQVTVDLDDFTEPTVQTGIGFFDHMLTLFGFHAHVGLWLTARGDLHVDAHHTIEDTGLALGTVIRNCLGEKQGIERYGHCLLPMDESMAEVALDFSGRPYFVWEAPLSVEVVGDLPTEMVPHFFKSFCDASGCTLHIRVRGENNHHLIEAAFKGFAKAFRMAIRKITTNPAFVMSTKGTLT